MPMGAPPETRVRESQIVPSPVQMAPSRLYEWPATLRHALRSSVSHFCITLSLSEA
jgi:hypothetical protein